MVSTSYLKTVKMKFCIFLALIGVTQVNTLYHPKVSSEFHENREFHDTYFLNYKKINQPNLYSIQHNNDTLYR